MTKLSAHKFSYHIIALCKHSDLEMLVLVIYEHLTGQTNI